MRGWRLAVQTRPRELPSWRAWCFLLGEAALWFAIASPIDALGQFLLLAHMTQHVLLMFIAPPLIVAGRPVVPLLRGLPRQFIRNDLAPWINLRAFEKLRTFVMHPATAWIAMNLAFVGWHIPAAYELALRSTGWHDTEHACFFITSTLFWWHVLRPWPGRSIWPQWAVLFYLASAGLVNTALSALLTFSGKVLYPTYALAPRIFSISALNDQAAAGAEMWVIGSAIFLAAAMSSVLELLTPEREKRRAAAQKPRYTQFRQKTFDLLRVPVAGGFLRSRFGRITLQSAAFLALAAVVVDGLRGTPLSSMNLAGALAWNFIRPVCLIAILLAGNFFCMACPFTVPREVARALGLARFRWPRFLSGKWPAIVLMGIFFWAYEQFSLWDSPRSTALVLIAYVLTALLVDSLFHGASFCKHICPIGQFNFVSSLISPLGINIRSASTCSGCSTHDCIRGNDSQRGCELQLYLPQKIGNMDCTMCMDCVKACPHDNIGITVTAPAPELIGDLPRSSIGRFSSRVDLALLVWLVSFSSLANAAYMIAPITDALDELAQRFPFSASNPGSLLLLVAAFGFFLLVWFGFAGLVRAWSGRESVRYFFCRFALAVLPLGLAVWTGHLAFHFATSSSSLVPIVQRAMEDLHPMSHMNSPAMHHSMPMNMSMTMPMASRPSDFMLVQGSRGFSLFNLQLWVLDVGMLLALYIGWRIVRPFTTSTRMLSAITAFWFICAGAFYAAAVWLFTQPMQMRGMGM
ncbi:MAG TPA: cytochrome c oxidase assembly protein [Terracidiphilus sp.]|nr:cytochrome c oxidase assembly protein [Terracidiphilus sp.]